MGLYNCSCIVVKINLYYSLMGYHNHEVVGSSLGTNTKEKKSCLVNLA